MDDGPTTEPAAIGDDAPGRVKAGSDEHVDDVPEMIRVATMLQTLVDEVRQVELDAPARERLATIQEQAVETIEQNLSPGLREELGSFAWPFRDDGPPSEAELRIAQAQLAGWLGGLFQGLQAAAMSRQLAQSVGSQPPGQLTRGEDAPARTRSGAYL